jgi:hypothetical protein
MFPPSQLAARRTKRRRRLPGARAAFRLHHVHSTGDKAHVEPCISQTPRRRSTARQRGNAVRAASRSGTDAVHPGDRRDRLAHLCAEPHEHQSHPGGHDKGDPAGRTQRCCRRSQSAAAGARQLSHGLLEHVQFSEHARRAYNSARSSSSMADVWGLRTPTRATRIRLQTSTRFLCR